MAKSFTGRKRIRKSFGRIPEVAPMPNLIEVQKSSYDHFLQMGVAAREPHQRRPAGSLPSVFPIRDFSDRARLEFVRYELEQPKYDVEECQQRGITFAAPLQGDAAPGGLGRRRGNRVALDPRHQGAGRLHGRHAAHDQERHLHHQRHRARHRLADAPPPGVFFDHDKGKTHSSGKYLFAARVIPYRGSWLDFEFDAKDHVYVRIDRRRKLPVTTLLYRARRRRDREASRASAWPTARRSQPHEAQGMSKEEILAYFYTPTPFSRTKNNKGWKAPFDPTPLPRPQADRTT